VKLLVIALALAYAAGLNLYATIGLLGIAARSGIIDQLPASLTWVMNPWVIAVVLLLCGLEFAATMMAGISSAWETLHSVIRPPAAAILAAAVVWSEDPLVVLAAALVGGLLAVVVHTAQLGMRYAIDSEQSMRSGLVANILELLLVAGVVVLVWPYPLLTLLIALTVLIAFMVIARTAVRALHQVITGHWMPGCGLLQEARTASANAPLPTDEDE
jgi:hypothetical protein